ncbi:MAG TPA: FAD-containing oxidoreductase [Devosia sp.]|jgi:pyruvate/2-oxoglutarate dehydrogenase complex dihydrolipoamide dehydrogenase (E3) component|uniref:FAD-containing oxidoreductase n=1 Tax=Devosia sp. TaxID=1871048 RepID=UPI002DDD600B|nr:FAD-containing oxidoreductase [Devosia sp.]HEV2515245.1 FAD-containing oxidoreductase [Devosia sp.]
MSRSFDAIVIGGGQAGPFLAARLAGAGQQVALIERRHMGGTCVNDGCQPTKTLVASARVAWLARRAQDFGVVTGPVSVDMAAVKARKEKVVLASRQGLDDWMNSTPNLTVLRGSAAFLSPHAVEVNGEVLEGKQFFLNTGARPVVPEWAAGVPYLTNTSILELDTLPRHLLIVGGSYIGLEFAQMYRRFGSEVTVLARSTRLAAKEDDDVTEAIRGILEGEGIQVITDARCMAAEQRDDGVAVHYRAGSEVVEGSHLLLAVGRVPNVEDLRLELAGVRLDDKGYIAVDDTLRTSQPHIYALGDVNGRGAFTHTSYNDFEIVSQNLLDGADRKVSERVPAYALYIDPPLGRAGMSEAEVRASGRKALVAVRPMTRVSRANERAENLGFMKVFADAETRQILGVALLGIEGDEVMQSLLEAMAAGVDVDTIIRTMHVHPTVSELVPTLLADLQPLN